MYRIGIDLGGTNIAAGIVTADGEILYKKSVPTQSGRGYAHVAADMVKLCQHLLDQLNLTVSDIGGIGIGSPGTIDREAGIILLAANLGFENVPLGKEIEKAFGLPVRLENDANVAALGEIVAGGAKGYKNAIMVTLGTGVGGGIIIDGKIFAGALGSGGEIGHHVIVSGGEPCTCGRLGCLEAYASATGIINAAKKAVKGHPDCGILKLAGNEEKITAKTVFDAYDQGDETAEALVTNYIGHLAEGIANLVNILQPQIFVMGGGVANRGEKLTAPLQQEVQKRVFDGKNNPVRIVPAILGNDAGIIGAAMLEGLA